MAHVLRPGYSLKSCFLAVLSSGQSQASKGNNVSLYLGGAGADCGSHGIEILSEEEALQRGPFAGALQWPIVSQDLHGCLSYMLLEFST